MNTLRTDNKPYEFDSYDSEPEYISFDNSWLDEPICLWKVLGLVLFVMAAVAGIAWVL
jgi:hypothetical protein